MDSIDIAMVSVRRWYVMLPILVGAAGVSYQLVQAQEPTYTAAASYGLVQPDLTPGDNLTESSPLGSAGDLLVGAALEARLNSREAQAELGTGDTRGWGPGDVVNTRSYDVRIPQFESTYEVRAWGEDEQEVRDVVERVIAAAPDITDELQIMANVPPPQRYQPFVLAPTQVEELPSTGWVKLVIAVMGVGLLMGAAWSVVVDRIMRGRRTRRRVPQEVEAPPLEEASGPIRTASPLARPPTSPSAEAKRETTEQTNGMVRPRANGAANGTASSAANGRTNGLANGAANGRASGRTNGAANGRANGLAAAKANGGTSGKATTPADRKPSKRR